MCVNETEGRERQGAGKLMDGRSVEVTLIRQCDRREEEDEQGETA